MNAIYQAREAMIEKIRKHFKDNNLPKPGVINYIGEWAKGDCYAVTTGLVRLKRFCVYCIDGEIHSVRQRDMIKQSVFGGDKNK